ncbi:MAG: TRAP transporter small permease [Rhodobacteraceae bacterium]|nr:TRAP transporter small permease [Paracoccaceae bacterium]
MSNTAGRLINSLEENLIAILLGLMTLVTFANVVARYLFGTNILWALELTVFMFAWLVLLGISYCVKIGAHLGVDAVLNMVGPKTRRVLGLISAAACIIFTLLMLKGSWDYWANFANLPATEGRWFPLGFEQDYRGNGWYEVNDIPMIAPLRFLESTFNDGDAYEKIPRFIPYAIMPISMALLLLRFCQATLRLWRGEISTLIASHEAEDAIEDAARLAGN